MNDGATQIGGIAAVRLQPGVSLFARTNARRGRTDHHGDAIGAVAFASFSGGIDEAVRDQPAPGETVVTTIPFRELRGERGLFEPRDAADPGGDRRRSEIVGGQAAAALA
jgi:hypothetical protein